MVTVRHALLLAGLIGSGLVMGETSADAASRTPRCPAVPVGAVLEDPTTLPPAISEVVRRELGDFAIPDGLFNPTDVVEAGARSNRILFVWQKAKRWVIATERGGRGYSNPILALDRDREKRPAKLVASRTAFPDNLCEIAAALLE